MRPSDKIRLVAVDVRGTVMTFLVTGIEPTFDEFLEDCQPILDSISFPEL